MALNPEFEKPPSFIPLSDLRKESVVKKLFLEGRTPLLLRTEEAALCFIPPKHLGKGQTLEVSIVDAKEIATIRDKLQREH